MEKDIGNASGSIEQYLDAHIPRIDSFENSAISHKAIGTQATASHDNIRGTSG